MSNDIFIDKLEALRKAPANEVHMASNFAVIEARSWAQRVQFCEVCFEKAEELVQQREFNAAYGLLLKSDKYGDAHKKKNQAFDTSIRYARIAMQEASCVSEVTCFLDLALNNANSRSRQYQVAREYVNLAYIAGTLFSRTLAVGYLKTAAGIERLSPKLREKLGEVSPELTGHIMEKKLLELKKTHWRASLMLGQTKDMWQKLSKLVKRNGNKLSEVTH